MASFSPDSKRGQYNLRRNRVSIPGARYFLTVCADKNHGALGCQEIFSECLAQASQLSRDKQIELIALVLMPDHLHAIIRLGDHSELSAALRLWKGRLSPVLRNAGARWQKGGYFEHRIRPDEPMEGILRYMLANPYRKKLLPLTANWPWWHCEPTTWEWFGPLTLGGRPHPEWLEVPPTWKPEPHS